jgi:hypothetical protein
MATTIPAAFAQLRRNLEITGLQESTVSSRQQNVRAAVERRLRVIDSFLTGSYPRSTMISPLADADIDIFFILDASYFNQYKPSGLLQALRDALRETYSSTPQISRNGQAVTISFTDFLVDAVPAFNRQGGGYLIGDMHTEKWISTDPKVHNKIITDANSSHNGDLVPLVKMIKGWNRAKKDPFRGFYLELLTLTVLDGVKISDFPGGVRFVLDKGREKVKYTIADPAGFGDQIGGLNNASTVQDAVAVFEQSYNIAFRAEQFASAQNVAAAINEWRKIFGDYLPAYG